MKPLHLITLAAFMISASSQHANAYLSRGRTADTALTPDTAQGDAIIITWTIVADGTETQSLYTDDDTVLESDFITRMDERHDIAEADRTDDLTNRTWFQAMELGLSYIAAKARLSFIYVDYDDGSALDLNDTIPGTVGVRADLRVGGLDLNNSTGYVPGGYSNPYNFDGVTAVTMNSEYAAYSSLVALRGVFMHEVGHSLGHNHSYVDYSKANNMMGYNIQGPQFDEIYSLQRDYGDTYEAESGNDSLATSYDLGVLNMGSTIDIGTDIQAGGDYEKMTATENDIVTIDDDADTDYYSFTINEENNTNITVNPTGPDSYVFALSTPSSPGYTCTPITNSDLSLRIYDSSNTLISTVDSTSNGGSESINLDLPAGTYYIRINGELENFSNSEEFFDRSDSGRAQFYSLTIESTSIPSLPAALGHWPMDEGSNTIVSDVSGNHYDGSITNTSNWATGQIDGALTFDTSADAISIPITPFSGLSDEITLSFWAYGADNQPTASYPIRAYGADGTEILRISLPNGQGRVIFDTWEDGSLDRVIQATADVIESEYMGAWNHWVFTKDASTGTMNIYLNGELKLTESGNNTGSIAGISTVSIGTNYNGLIDDFIMWDEEISASQVLEIYNNTPPEAVAQSLETELNTSVITTLSGIETDDQDLSYTIDQTPTNGSLSGTVPDLTYTPDTDYFGVDSYTYYVNDSVVNSYPVTVTITVTGGGYDTWADAYSDSTSNFEEDTDGDGIPNGVEYILNTDPVASDSTKMTEVAQTASHNVITFERSAASTADTTQILQYGSDLIQWTDITFTDDTPAEVEIGSIDGDMETVTVSISNTEAPEGKFFYRIKAIRN